jgi:DNA-binding response OmpR family regulator
MSRPKVLVVDDDAFIRRPLQYLLEKAGFETDVACDGVECLEKMEERWPDLVCLDLMMPRQDGFATCEAIRNETSRRRVAIILLSAKGQESDRERGLALGADDFISKPYSPSDLIARIRAILAIQHAGEALQA